MLLGQTKSGKSTLLNSLTQQKDLAHTSSKGFSTRIIHKYLLGSKKAILVDTPHFDPHPKISAPFYKSSKLVKKFIEDTSDILLNLYIINAEVGIRSVDITALQELEYYGRPFQVAVNKIDTRNYNNIGALLIEISSLTKEFRFCHHAIHLMSALCGNGVIEMSGQLALLIDHWKPLNESKEIEQISTRKINTSNVYY